MNGRFSFLHTITVPVLVFLILAGGFAGAWMEAHHRQRQLLATQTRVTAEQAAARLEDVIRFRLALVDQIRREWEIAPFPDREAFERRSLGLQREFAGFLAVSWIDPQGIIRWTAPRAPNRAAEDQDLHHHPFAGATFSRAEATLKPQVTPPVELYQGGLGLASYFPIVTDGELLGYINGVFRIRPLVESTLRKPVLENYTVRIDAGGRTVFANGAAAGASPRPATATVPFAAAGQTWSISLAPSTPLVTRARAVTQNVLLVFGILLALALGWLTRLYLVRQSEVARSETKYRKLFEESIDVVYITTADGKFLDINEAGVRLFGAGSKEELLAVNIAETLYTDPRHREKLLETLDRDGFVQDYRVPLKGLDGRPIQARFSCAAEHDRNGNLVTVRGILHDDTEEVRLAEQIGEMQRMESLSNLAGGIAHDFNNTLGAVLSRASLIRMKKPDPEIDAHAAAIEASVESASKLTSRLLSFSRGEVQPRTPVAVNDIVDRTVGILRRTISPRVTIETNLADGLPLVDGGETRLQQILLNLCVNARDAMPDGGRLSLTTELRGGLPAKIPAQEGPLPESWVVLTVADTGTGMDEETRKHAFEPFFTTKSGEHGTGLGLAVVFGVVASLGGQVQMETSPGEGTTVAVFLPAGSGETPAVAPVRPAATPEGATLLLVDDDPSLRAALKDVLETHHFVVVEAEDGEQAVDLYAARPGSIDVVILDMTMPRLDGPQTFERLKQIDPGVRVIVSTGYSRADGGQELLEQGAVAFLHKPYRAADLIATVRNAMS